MTTAPKEVTTERGSKDVQIKNAAVEKIVPGLDQILRKQIPEANGGKTEVAAEAKLKKTQSETTAQCPDCDAKLEIPAETELGEILSCPGCGLELEVKTVKRDEKGKECVDLQELTIEGEDWGE